MVGGVASSDRLCEHEVVAMTSQPAAPPSGNPQAQPSVADRLRAACIGLRQDLEVSRSVFRDGVRYIVRDPMSFETHSFTAEDYRVLVSLRQQSALGEVFERLVASGELTKDREDAFYAFVLSVHRLGFLSLPISDDKGLYAKYERKKAAQRKALRWAFMSWQMPLWNPDRFLERTIRYVGWLYTRWAMFGWCVLMFVAGSVAYQRWGDLSNSLTGILAAEQLVGMWFVLIVLKVFHELGHAYACKRFGGHVPEIGAYFIMMTPCAYMDASASWGFKHRWQRIVVTLGGMYIESIIAAMALFVWASTEPSMVNAMAYQILLLSSVITIAFNINPLMRFDGYFLLCDIIGIPNLRAQANRALNSTLNRYLLGITTPCPDVKLGGKIALILYGISSTVYKTSLVLGIASMIAMKFFLFGVAIACVYVTKAVAGFVLKTTRFLWFAPETAPVRLRAIAISCVLLIAIPCVVAFVPISTAVDAQGVLTFEHEYVVTARESGFLDAILVRPGDTVLANQMVAHIDNPIVAVQLDSALSALQSTEAQIRMLRQQPKGAGSDAETEARHEALSVRRDVANEALNELSVAATAEGRVLSALNATHVGSYVPAGSEVARIGAGRILVEAFIDERDVTSADVAVGDTVVCRSRLMPEHEIRGTVESISQFGTHEISRPSLTIPDGGTVPVDPSTRIAERAWYLVVVSLQPADFVGIQLDQFVGSHITVRLPTEQSTMGWHALRRLLQFRDRLEVSS